MALSVPAHWTLPPIPTPPPTTRAPLVVVVDAIVDEMRTFPADTVTPVSTTVTPPVTLKPPPPIVVKPVAATLKMEELPDLASMKL